MSPGKFWKSQLEAVKMRKQKRTACYSKKLARLVVAASILRLHSTIGNIACACYAIYVALSVVYKMCGLGKGQDGRIYNKIKYYAIRI